MSIPRKFKMVPRYLRLLKLCTSHALCQYNKSKTSVDKKIFNILNDAQYIVETSYRKHKKIGDPVECLHNFVDDLLKKCEKLRLLYKTVETKKIFEKHTACKTAFRRLVRIYDEMLIELAE